MRGIRIAVKCLDSFWHQQLFLFLRFCSFHSIFYANESIFQDVPIPVSFLFYFCSFHNPIASVVAKPTT